jgi:nucleoside-specific outer membrane channel protein Tsx
MSMRLDRLSLVFLLAIPAAHGADWSATEFQYQHGVLASPAFAGKTDAATNIYTLQHASGWGFGDVFFFIDNLHDSRQDGANFNDNDYYGELYVNFSLGKLSGKKVGAGPIRDVGLLLGINAGRDAKVRKYLPGIRLSWDIPGFAFLNTDFTAYLDDSAGAARGGAPAESDSQMVDVNWAYPFSLGRQSFSIEGHVEYIGKRSNEFGAEVSPWILAQPQFRWDAGKAFYGRPNQLFLGIEYQYWRNKLGDKSTSESRPQALLVWRF